MNRTTTIAAALTFALLSMPGTASAKDRTEVVRFKAGASSATVSGRVKGYDVARYVLDASAGQMVHILFNPNHGACYFNFSRPGADSADFIGEVSGNELSIRLRQSGKHRAEVYLMRSAARRGETCKYSISFEITGKVADGSAGSSGSPADMMAACRIRAHEILRTKLGNIETKYEGQRTDGTHAVNGMAMINGIDETFQCSFNASGHKIVHFIVNH
ncbi:MAG: hypothetical protein KDK89_02865 [Alphaproteobacteria bacterium]|nr:hypothetical protein [Alphaproteobacteria bacterium]